VACLAIVPARADDAQSYFDALDNCQNIYIDTFWSCVQGGGPLDGCTTEAMGAYGTCLFAIHVQPTELNFCDQARQAAASCNAAFPPDDPDNWEVRSACLQASLIWQCE
jgi:hypothetical protein